MGLGLRKGMIHLVWNLGWFSRTELTIPSATIKVNDGAWHSIKINRVRQSLDIEIDGEIYNSRVTGSYYELNTADTVLVGKFSLVVMISDNSRILCIIACSISITILLFFRGSRWTRKNIRYNTGAFSNRICWMCSKYHCSKYRS